MSGPTWIGSVVKPGCKGRTYWLRLASGSLATGVVVQHCGHPTANTPYTVEVPWSRQIIVAPSGRGFQHLADAKAEAIRQYLRWEATQ